MADYSGLFGQYSNLQQPTQDPFAPLLAPPPPVAPPPPALPRPKPANPYEARQQEAMDAANTASMAAAMKQQAHQDAIIAKTSAAEAQRANHERDIEETRAKVFADVDARQQALINEATQGEKVDPRGRFGNAGTGAKLALGVMGFLQGFIDPKGGPGKMAAWVDNIVQKDIATQMANIEQKNRVLGLKQSALDKGVARDSAMLDAQLAATARAYDGAQRIVAAEAAKNPAMAEMAQAAQAELQMKMQEKFEQNRQQNRQIGIQAAGVALEKARFEEQKKQNALNFFVGQNDRITAISEKERDREAKQQVEALKHAGMPEGFIPNTGDPRGGTQLVSKEVLPEVIKKKVAIEQYIGNNHRLMDLVKQNPGHQWDNFLHTSEGMAQIQSLAADMVANANVMNGQGAMGDAEREAAIKAKVGEIGGWLKKSSTVRMEENIRTAERNYNSMMKGYAVPGSFDGGLSYDAAKQGWFKRVGSEEPGAIVGSSKPSNLTANARGVDENGRPRDIPFVPLIEEETRGPNVGPALIDYYRLLQQQGQRPGS